MRVHQMPRLRLFLEQFFCMGAMVLLAVIIVGRGYGFVMDDSYILFRYVDNLADGYGIAFNPHEHVEGLSCMLWAFILAGLRNVTGVDTITVTKITGFVFLLFTLVFAYALEVKQLRSRDPESSLAPYKAVFVPLLALLLPSTVMWAVSGMENPLYSFLLVAHLFFLFRRNAAVAALCACLLLITRPEAMVFCSLAIFLVHFEPLQNSAVPWTLRIRPFLKENRSFFVYTLIVVAFFAALTAFRLYYFHDFVPNTVRVKSPHTLLSAASLGYTYLKSFAVTNLGFALLFSLAVLLLPIWRKERFALLCFATVLIQLVFIVLVGGDWMDYHRFIASFTPIAALLIVEAFSLAAASKRKFYIATNSLALGLLLFIGWNAEQQYARISPKNYEIESTGVQLGKWLNENSPKDALLAVGDAGMIPYFSKLRLLDLHGLMDPHIARSIKDFALAPHAEIDTKYVFKRRPTWLVLILGQSVDELGDKAGGAYAIYNELRTHKDFKKYYRYAGEFVLASYYRYAVYYDTRQISKNVVEVEMTSDRPETANLYFNDDLSKAYPFPLHPACMEKHTVTRYGPPLSLLRLDPSVSSDTQFQLRSVAVTVDGARSERTGQSITLAAPQMSGVDMLDEDNDRLKLRVTGNDPMLVFDINRFRAADPEKPVRARLKWGK